MNIKERFFVVQEEWSVIHLPRKPNGFAIFLMGDVNHYVSATTSSWHQHPIQAAFIKELKEAGYTIICSNLHGRHWGSNQACECLQRTYEEVMKKEILNKKAHIIAEGMGALLAAKLVPNLATSFRSVIMINPCLNLKSYFQREKSNKLFYKRFLKELKKAYCLEEAELEELVATMDMDSYQPMAVATKIFHYMHATPYSLQSHVRPYEKLYSCSENNVDVSIFLASKPYQDLAKPVTQFLKKHELYL